MGALKGEGGAQKLPGGRGAATTDCAECCDGEPVVCPWYWRAKLCRAGDCPATEFVYVCSDATCLDGAPMVLATVFRFGGHCYRVETACKYWLPPQKEPEGGCVHLVPPGGIIVEGSRECVPNCDDPRCDPLNTHYPLVLCSCTGSGSLTNAWMPCADYWNAIANGCTCPTVLIPDDNGKAVCATADAANPGVPGAGARIIIHVNILRSCCQCCAKLAGNPCVHFPPTSCGKVPFDPYGVAAIWALPIPQVGKCCCSDLAEADVEYEYDDTNFQFNPPQRYKARLSGTVAYGSGGTITGFFQSNDDPPNPESVDCYLPDCAPEVQDSSGIYFGRIKGLGGASRIDVGSVSANCDRYAHRLSRSVFFADGRLLAIANETLRITLRRNAGACDEGCGKSVPPVELADGAAAHDPRSPAQRAHEDGCHGCGG